MGDATANPAPSRFEALVFDLDGTLIDSTPGIEGSLAGAFQAAGRVMPAADLRRVIGPPIRVIARRIEPSLTEAEMDVIETVYRSHYDGGGWRETRLFPGVDGTLRTLHATGMQCFIVTNKPLIPTSSILAHLSLDSIFTEVLTRDSRTPPFASKAAMLADLLARWELDAESTLMIGDTIEDQEAAHSNHLDFLHVTYGYGSVPEGVPSVDSFSQIATHVRSAGLPNPDLQGNHPV